MSHTEANHHDATNTTVHHENEPSRAVNTIATRILDSAFAVHRALGPGLLETVYEHCLSFELESRALTYERQKALDISYLGRRVPNALRLDLIVEGCVIVETKAVEELIPLHHAQLLTYLRLSTLRLGLLINFNVRLLKDGIRRVVL